MYHIFIMYLGGHAAEDGAPDFHTLSSVTGGVVGPSLRLEINTRLFPLPTPIQAALLVSKLCRNKIMSTFNNQPITFLN